MATWNRYLSVNIEFVSIHISDSTLRADIEEDVILGIDIMKTYSFQLDFKHKLISIGTEELILHQCETPIVEGSVSRGASSEM